MIKLNLRYYRKQSLTLAHKAIIIKQHLADKSTMNETVDSEPPIFHLISSGTYNQSKQRIIFKPVALRSSLNTSRTN